VTTLYLGTTCYLFQEAALHDASSKSNRESETPLFSSKQIWTFQKGGNHFEITTRRIYIALYEDQANMISLTGFTYAQDDYQRVSSLQYGPGRIRYNRSTKASAKAKQIASANSSRLSERCTFKNHHQDQLSHFATRRKHKLHPLQTRASPSEPSTLEANLHQTTFYTYNFLTKRTS
jgi:hypothetical protein